ncbi:MAG TPA: hypothetical protein VEV17_20700 [Bryobacteraceae bacterium]|nr:hypothetical protein [Bryobacteraceae bacterium]
MEEWEELLGQPPRDLNLLGLLNLAHLAAGAQLRGLQSEPYPSSGHESDRREEMLQDIQRAQTEAQQREDAMIDALARIASHVEGNDPYACENSLLDELSNTWKKLTARVRNQLLASEQMHRIHDFAAPGKIIDALATAFELQLQHSVMAGLFDFLKYRQLKSLVAPQEWKDVERREKPLWKPGERVDKYTLGTMRLILRHPQVEIGEFFTQYGLDRGAIVEATEAVYQHRNPAVHGHGFDIGTVGQIRKDWFSWKNRVGGIYSVFFRSGDRI